jgi:hypothetical protein
MDYEYQEKKEGNLLAEIHTYIVFKIHILYIRFHQIFFVCECQLRRNFILSSNLGKISVAAGKSDSATLYSTHTSSMLPVG